MAANLVENDIELAALDWFQALDYSVVHGPHIAPGEASAERDSFGEVVLVERLRVALRRLNGAIPEEAREEALRKVLRVVTPALTQTNRNFHRMLRDGVPVEYDERHNDYGYTQASVDFLIEKLKDAAEFDAVCKSDQAAVAASQST